MCLFFLITSCQKDDNFLEVNAKAQNEVVFSKLLQVAKSKKESYNVRIKTKNYFSREVDNSFKTKYGTPEFEKSINFTKEDGTPILIIPLTNEYGNVTKLLFGFMDNGEEKFLVVDESAKEGDILVINRNYTQEKVHCPLTNIGSKQLGGLFKAAEMTIENREDCSQTLQFGLDTAFEMFPDNDCFTVQNLGGCTFAIEPVECPNTIEDVDGPGNGGGNSTTTGSTGTGNTNDHDNDDIYTGGGSGSGGNNTNPTDPQEDNDEPNNDICGEDPFEICMPLDSTDVFVQDLYDAFGEENIAPFCDSDEVENLPAFDTIEEAQVYLDSLLEGNFSNVSSEVIDDFGSIRRDIHKMNFSDFPQADIVASIKVMVPEPNNQLECLSILNVRTILEGNNTLFDWTQLDSESTLDPNGPLVVINEQYDVISAKVEGQMLIGLNIDGYPIKKRVLLTVQIKYNYTTGELDPNWSYWYYTTI